MLKPKKRKFADEYLIDLDKTAAAIRAGYKPDNARIVAQKIYNDPEVKEYIEKKLADISERLNLKAIHVIQELKDIGLSDIKDYLSFDENGVIFKNSDEVNGKCISEVSSVKTTTTQGEIVTDKVTFKLKLYDKPKSLELLGKYFKLWIDKIEVNHNFNPEEAKKKIEEIFLH